MERELTDVVNQGPGSGVLRNIKATATTPCSVKEKNDVYPALKNRVKSYLRSSAASPFGAVNPPTPSGSNNSKPRHIIIEQSWLIKP